MVLHTLRARLQDGTNNATTMIKQGQTYGKSCCLFAMVVRWRSLPYLSSPSGWMDNYSVIILCSGDMGFGGRDIWTGTDVGFVWFWWFELPTTTYSAPMVDSSVLLQWLDNLVQRHDVYLFKHVWQAGRQTKLASHVTDSCAYQRQARACNSLPCPYTFFARRTRRRKEGLVVIPPPTPSPHTRPTHPHLPPPYLPYHHPHPHHYPHLPPLPPPASSHA